MQAQPCKRKVQAHDAGTGRKRRVQAREPTKGVKVRMGLAGWGVQVLGGASGFANVLMRRCMPMRANLPALLTLKAPSTLAFLTSSLLKPALP